MTRLLTSGGAERVAANLATELNKSHNVILVVFDGRNATYDCDADVIDLKMPMQKKPIKKALWYLKAIKKVQIIKKKFSITHTISFLNEADFINVLTHGGKSIVSVRSRRSTANKNAITFIKDKMVFKKADKIVALSKGVKEDLVSNYNVKPEMIKVIYNPCDADRIRVEASIKPEDEFLQLLGGYDVVNAGRLVDEKGQWHLIRAFKRVVESIPGAKLFIFGIGPHEEYLKQLISNQKLMNNVYMMGFRNNPYSYMSKCTLYAFSSIREGFGNILLEAMACNLPVMASDCLYGPRELLDPNSEYSSRCKEFAVDGKYGVLVPCCDEKKYTMESLTKEELIMADEIISLLMDKQKLGKLRIQSKERIKDFTPGKIKKEWEKVMLEM